MRLRYWTALAVTGCIALVVTFGKDDPEQDAAPNVDQAPLTSGPSGQNPDGADRTDDVADGREPVPAFEDDGQDTAIQDAEVTFSRSVGVGESLYILLAEAGLDADIRAGVAAAIGSEYDLRRLKPGHMLDLAITPDGTLQSATLEIEDGVRIRAVFGDEPAVNIIPPALDTVHRAGEAEIGSSIYAALEAAGIPTRFATDLELVLAGTLDLRSALAGGEQLGLVWREGRLGDRVIGEPTIDFAKLDLGEDRYEILWPQDGARTTRIYKNEQLLLVFEQPIKGARLSSSFGTRTHPIHGNLRMHSGVDFAAPLGADIHATRSGRVVFAGPRGGYGKMVEIDHARNIRTIYAHLSSVKDTLKVGQRVNGGDPIGRVGSTGMSTAPHLHYEVIVKDRPVPPLTDTHLLQLDGGPPDASDDPVDIATARKTLARLLEQKGAEEPSAQN
jgi:hypothetical protein